MVVLIVTEDDVERVRACCWNVHSLQGEVALEKLNVYAVGVPADESARNAVIGIERAERCSEFETVEAVGGADGETSIFDFGIFKCALGCFHVAHVARGNFTFERNSENVSDSVYDSCKSGLPCFGVVRDVAVEKRIVKRNVLMLDVYNATGGGERLCENLWAACDT